MKSILKSVVMGIALGATFFFLPGIIFAMIVFGIFFKIIFRGRMRHQMGNHRLAFADKIRNMSEEEFGQFKTNFGSRNFGPNCNSRNNLITK